MSGGWRVEWKEVEGEIEGGEVAVVE